MSEAFFWRLAASLSTGRRVMLVDAPVDALMEVAAVELTELVAITPGSAARAVVGTTVHGSPLRLRPDARERAGSKELVVDRHGRLEAEDVRRVLSRGGLYVTGLLGPAFLAFEHRTEVEVRACQGLVCEGDALGLDAGLGEVALRIFVGSRVPVPVLPGLFLPSPPPVLVESEANHVREQAEAALEAAQADLSTLRLIDRRNDAQKARWAEERQTRNTELEAARRRVSELEGDRADFEALRARAAEARTDTQLAVDALAFGLKALDLPLPAPPAVGGPAMIAFLNLAKELLERVGLDRRAAESTPLGTRTVALEARLEEQHHRLRREVDERRHRENDLEALLRAHLELEAMLGQTVEILEAERDTLLAERHTADANLALLRDEVALMRSGPAVS